MLNYTLVIIAITVICASAFTATKRYNTYINPWVMFFGIEVFILHSLSIFSAFSLGLIDLGNEFDLLITCSALYILGYAISFWIKIKKFDNIAFFVIDIIPDVRPGIFTASISIILYIVGMLILVYFGAAGLLWLTDPRMAYIGFRGATGDGALYAFAQWTLITAAAVCLFSANLRTWVIYGTLIIFVGLAYFLGSKQIMLNIFIFALFVFDRLGRKINIKTLVFYFLLLSLIFISLLLETDVGDDLSVAGYYFSEYAVNTMKIFSSYLGAMFAPGEFLISNIWAYIPRFLFPDKPYEYGQVLINSVLFPGAAEQGATPGLLYWSPYYLESGFLGVFSFGLIRGLVESSFFQALRRVTNQPLKLLLAFSLSVTPMFLFAPPLYQYLFVFAISALIRIISLGRIGRDVGDSKAAIRETL